MLSGMTRWPSSARNKPKRVAISPGVRVQHRETWREEVHHCLGCADGHCDTDICSVARSGRRQRLHFRWRRHDRTSASDSETLCLRAEVDCDEDERTFGHNETNSRGCGLVFAKQIVGKSYRQAVGQPHWRPTTRRSH